MQNSKKERRIRTSTMKFIGIACVVGIFILTFTYCYAWSVSEDLVEQRSNTDAFKTIDLEDFAGNSFTRDNMEGTKLIAFNIWETTCPACLGEMDDLEKLTKEYDPSEFQLVGMCADLYDKDGKIKPEQLEKAKKLMEDAGVTFPNLIPDQEFMDYFRSTIVGFPTTFFVNSEGEVISATAGSNNLEGWKEYVDRELQKVQ